MEKISDSQQIPSKYYKIQHPSNILISGVSGSGKSFLVRNILKHYKTVFVGFADVPVLKVIWCYGIWQDLYEVPISDNVTISYYNGFPIEKTQTTEFENMIDSGCHIIVLDDLMENISNSNYLSRLFSQISHHKKITIMFLVQNLLYQAAKFRTVSLNSHYIIYFRNPRDQVQLKRLISQVDPGDIKRVLEIYNDATKKAYGYLLIDFRPTTPYEYRYKTNIVPEALDNNNIKYSPIIYMPKQTFKFINKKSN